MERQVTMAPLAHVLGANNAETAGGNNGGTGTTQTDAENAFFDPDAYNAYFTNLVDNALQEAETQALAERVNAMSLCLERASSSNSNGNSIDIVGASARTADDSSPSSSSESTAASLELNTYAALMPDDMKRHVAGFLEKPKFKYSEQVLSTITKNRRERDTKMVQEWVENATLKILEKCRQEAEKGHTYMEILTRNDFDDFVGGRPAKCNFHNWGNENLDIFTNGVKLVAKKLKSLGFNNVKCEYSRGTNWPHQGALRVEWPVE